MNNEELYFKYINEKEDYLKDYLIKEIFEKNIYVINKISGKYTNIEKDEKYQLAYISIYKTLNNFDINKGHKFITLFSLIYSNELRMNLRKSNNYNHEVKFKKEESINLFKSNIDLENDLEIKDFLERLIKISEIKLNSKEFFILKELIKGDKKTKDLMTDYKCNTSRVRKNIRIKLSELMEELK